MCSNRESGRILVPRSERGCVVRPGFSAPPKRLKGGECGRSVMPMKPLACWLGKHSWMMRIEHGEEFAVCATCGKERGGGPGGGGAQREHEWERAHNVDGG